MARRVKKSLLIIAIFISPIFILTGRTRIMTYNLENYGGYILPNNTTQYQKEDYREEDLRMIIDKIDPDILTVEEVFGQYSGAQRFLNNVVNYKTYTYKTVFIDQTQDNGPEDIWQDIAVYYKKDKFRLIKSKEVDITPGESYVRNVIKVELEKIAHRDTLIIFGVHLKAGSGREDRDKRKFEAKELREHCNNLSNNKPFLICGDLNLYSSSEPAWNYLTERQSVNKGRVFDPTNRIGEWHNNQMFKDLHTQSTRKKQGGLDDRFDFILVSGKIRRGQDISYINNTYTTFGNDGMHFNQSINWNKNQEVSERMAEALYNASDHLPVYADFKFDSTNLPKIRLFQNFPNPFKSHTKIKFYLKSQSRVKVTIFDLKGRLVKTIKDTTFESGNSIVNWDGTDEEGVKVSSGVYLCRVKAKGSLMSTKKIILMK